MKTYRASVKLMMTRTKTNVWIEIQAPNVHIARAMLNAQYGKDNVLAVIQKSGQ